MYRASVVISDPWEIAIIIGCAPLEGNIDIGVGTPSRFQFDQAVLVNGAWMTSADVTVRHVGSTLTATRIAVTANILLQSCDRMVTCATIGTVSID